MAYITSAVVIKSSNEDWRPFAEELRAIIIRARHLKAKYNGEVSSILSSFSAADEVADGRTNEGVVKVTKNDIMVLLQMMDALDTTVGTTGNLATIEKFAVRPLLVE